MVAAVLTAAPSLTEEFSTAISFPGSRETVASVLHPGVKASGGEPFMSITDRPGCMLDVTSRRPRYVTSNNGDLKPRPIPRAWASGSTGTHAPRLIGLLSSDNPHARSPVFINIEPINLDIRRDRLGEGRKRRVKAQRRSHQVKRAVIRRSTRARQIALLC